MNYRRHAAHAVLFAAFAAGASHGQRLEDVFAEVHEAVVTIRTVQQEWVAEPEATLVSSTTVGSGVLLSLDGDVLTTAHVVDLADRITVDFVGGAAVEARIEASDPESDLAMMTKADV